jgi:hypothetical protein
MMRNLYFVVREKPLKDYGCIVAVHMKSPLRSIEDRERNEKGSGRAQKLRIFVRSGLGAAAGKAGNSKREWGRKGEVKPS